MVKVTGKIVMVKERPFGKSFLHEVYVASGDEIAPATCVTVFPEEWDKANGLFSIGNNVTVPVSVAVERGYLQVKCLVAPVANKA